MSSPLPSFSRSTVTAVMAIITATIALGVGVWENVQMREHNRLSVTPHLQLIVQFQTVEADTVEQAIIRMTNEGVGPAVIDRVEVSVTGPDGQKQRFETWGEARALVKEVYGTEFSKRAEIGPGIFIGADRTYDLVVAEKPSAGETPLFPSFLEHIDLRISYHSVYGEPFETDLGRQRALAGI